ACVARGVVGGDALGRGAPRVVRAITAAAAKERHGERRRDQEDPHAIVAPRIAAGAHPTVRAPCPPERAAPRPVAALARSGRTLLLSSRPPRCNVYSRLPATRAHRPARRRTGRASRSGVRMRDGARAL